MFVCLECGKKFRTARAAERASYNGCPKCGGEDIAIDVTERRFETLLRNTNPQPRVDKPARTADSEK
jgi:predicted  nucleic acid-binding Zn-ribbon protein